MMGCQFHYSILLETNLEILFAGLSKCLCWRSPRGKNCRWPLGAEGDRQRQPVGSRGPESYSKETTANNRVSLEADSSPVKPADENIVQPTS